MIEIITAIALLCQVSSRATYNYLEKQQLACQKQYLKCVRDNGSRNLTRGLEDCIVKRVIKKP